MSINLNEIAQKKINEMEESGEIKKRFEGKLQELILDSISSALDGWEIKKKIREKIETQVAPCLDTLDFTAYNSFICEKVKHITEEYLKEDIAKKISSTFEKIFMLKRDSIKLSEIFEAYQDWLIDGLEENEKYDLDNEFYANIEESDGCWLECSISERAPDNNSTYYGTKRKDVYSCDFGFVVYKKLNQDGNGYIRSVYFEGNSVSDVLEITSYNKFQSLLLNLYYNKTPIILDIDNGDDIYTSLGLDI